LTFFSRLLKKKKSPGNSAAKKALWASHIRNNKKYVDITGDNVMTTQCTELWRVGALSVHFPGDKLSAEFQAMMQAAQTVHGIA